MLIHLCLAIGPVALSPLQYLEAILCGLNDELGQPVDIYALRFILSDEQSLATAPNVQQIVDRLIVNLNEAAVDCHVLRHFFEQGLNTTRYDSSCLCPVHPIVGFLAEHSVGFSRSCLAVSKYGAIEPIDHFIDGALQIFENLLLIITREDLRELELEMARHVC